MIVTACFVIVLNMIYIVFLNSFPKGQRTKAPNKYPIIAVFYIKIMAVLLQRRGVQ